MCFGSVLLCMLTSIFLCGAVLYCAWWLVLSSSIGKSELSFRLSRAFVLCVVLAAMLLVALCVQLVVLVFGFNIHLFSFFYLLSVVPFLVLFPFFVSQGRISFKDIGFVRKNLLRAGLDGVLLGVVVGLFGWLLRFVFDIETGVVPVGGEVSFFVVLFFSCCIAAPIWEEIAVRGLFFAFVENVSFCSEFLKKNGGLRDVLVVVVVSLFFLAGHLDRSSMGLFVIFISSLFYSIGFLKSRNIVVPMVAHFVFNLFVVVQPFVLPVI